MSITITICCWFSWLLRVKIIINWLCPYLKWSKGHIHITVLEWLSSMLSYYTITVVRLFLLMLSSIVIKRHFCLSNQYCTMDQDACSGQKIPPGSVFILLTWYWAILSVVNHFKILVYFGTTMHVLLISWNFLILCWISINGFVWSLYKCATFWGLSSVLSLCNWTTPWN